MSKTIWVEGIDDVGKTTYIKKMVENYNKKQGICARSFSSTENVSERDKKNNKTNIEFWKDIHYNLFKSSLIVKDPRKDDNDQTKYSFIDFFDRSIISTCVYGDRSFKTFTEFINLPFVKDYLDNICVIVCEDSKEIIDDTEGVRDIYKNLKNIKELECLKDRIIYIDLSDWLIDVKLATIKDTTKKIKKAFHKGNKKV